MGDVKPCSVMNQNYGGTVMHGDGSGVLKYLHVVTTLLCLITIFTTYGGESNRRQVFTWIAELNTNTSTTVSVDLAPNDHFMVPETELQKAYVPDRVNTFVVDEYHDFKDNPVLFYATAWTVGSLNVVTTDDLFRSYLDLSETSLSMLSRKLSNFLFCQADLRVTVVVQGNSVAMGKMVISFDPTPNGARQTTITNHVPAAQATRAMLLPCIEIDPAESKTYTIDLPAPTIWGLYGMHSGAYSAGETLGSYRMKQHVINALGSGTAVIPSIDISVYLSLVEPKLVGATINTNYTLTSALKKEKTDGSGGVISSYFKKASSIASVVAKIPVPMISEAATLFGGVTEAAGNFMAWFGYSKPLVNDVGHTRVTADANWSLIDNALQAQPMSWRSNVSVGLSGASTPLYDPRESIISELASKPGLIRIFTIPVVTAPNTLIGAMDVNPMKQRVLDDPGIGNGYELTPLAYVCYPYRYWRCDMKYKLEFVSSVFHRCTVVVLYDPGSGGVAGAINRYLSVLQHWTFQVSGHMIEEIEIPWKQVVGMKSVAVPSSSVVASAGVATSTNGQLYFCLLNSVTTNGSTDPVRINVYASASNLRLAGTTARQFAQVVISPPALMGGGNEELFEVEETEEATEVVFTSMKSQDDSGFFGQYFGEEQAHTIKELGSRQTPLATIAFPPNAFVAESISVTIPNGHLTSSDFVPGDFFLSSVTDGGNCLVDYLSSAFVGVRGSYDYSYFPNSGRSTPIQSVYATNRFGIARPGSSPLTVGMSTRNWGATVVSYMELNPSLQVNSPFYYEGMFRPTYQTAFCENDGIRFIGMQVTGPILDSVVSLLKSGGDDFMYVGFRGLPSTIFTA